jgi:LytS/YehU family sensor histidine kinase
VVEKEWYTFSIKQLAFRILITGLVMSLIWSLWTVPINTVAISRFNLLEEEFQPIYYFTIWISLSFITILWLLIYFGINVFKNYKQSEIEKWKLQAIVKDAELIALKAQINPHFIFNSLNNIRSLIIEDAEKARQMIIHLSDLLRYSIQFTNQEKVTIENEMAVVKDYLELESIQFEERLHYDIRVDRKALEIKIPPMSIQLLVENAIKHGISTLPKGGEISISVNYSTEGLEVAVENTGELQETSNGTGIGIKNANERLKLLFGEQVKFRLENVNGSKVKAGFFVPKMKGMK